jgi:hypothetical protein
MAKLQSTCAMEYLHDTDNKWNFYTYQRPTKPSKAAERGGNRIRKGITMVFVSGRINQFFKDGGYRQANIQGKWQTGLANRQKKSQDEKF